MVLIYQMNQKVHAKAWKQSSGSAHNDKIIFYEHNHQLVSSDDSVPDELPENQELMSK